MKKFITLIRLFIIALTSHSQAIVNQSISAGPYKVGDTITVTYTVDDGTATNTCTYVGTK